MLLGENSISRLIKHNTLHDCGVISAFIPGPDRGDTKEYPQTGAGKNKLYHALNLHKKEMMKRDKSLFNELRSSGYDVTRVRGAYTYETGEMDREQSWFVVDKDDTGKLKKDLIKLGSKFGQESILYLPKNGKGFFIWTKPNHENKVGWVSPVKRGTSYGAASGGYFSEVGSRPFQHDIDYEFGPEEEMHKKQDNFNKMNEQSDRFKHSFDTVYESFYSRYTSGLFTKGDIVEFDKAILNDPIFKAMPEEMQTRIKEMVEADANGDAIIAVANVCLSPLMADTPEASSLTLGYSQGGGMYYGQTTVSGSLGQYLKIKSGVETIVPKNAIRQHKETARAVVDMDSVKQAFKTGYARDIRKTADKK